MADNTVALLDENTRRYYLDAMGIQCWETLPTQEIEDNGLSEEKVVERSALPLLEIAVKQCEKCSLHKTRKQAILGRGDQQSDLMFVLLSPTEKDEENAVICTGEANTLLTKMLTAIDVSINDVYITSLLKCHVPSNHTASSEEFKNCRTYLKQQIKLVQPKLLVVLGETSARYILQSDLVLDDMRDETNDKSNDNLFESVPIFVSYSPQELLLMPENKRKAWSDLQKIQKIIF